MSCFKCFKEEPGLFDSKNNLKCSHYVLGKLEYDVPSLQADIGNQGSSMLQGSSKTPEEPTVSTVRKSSLVCWQDITQGTYVLVKLATAGKRAAEYNPILG